MCKKLNPNHSKISLDILKPIYFLKKNDWQKDTLPKMNVDVDVLIPVNDEDYQSNTRTIEILKSLSIVSSHKDTALKGLYLKTLS